MADLKELVAPGRVAVVTMELQRGVMGDLACIPALADAVREAGIVPATARVLRAARARGVRVPMVNRLLDANPDHLVVGTPPTQVVPELGPEPQDLESQRLHGMSPFQGTSLEPWLRAEGVTTVIATGVSLNVGITGLTIEAINRGFDVVVPTDCVAGYPLDYGKLVLERTIAQLATLTSSAALVEAWGG